MLSQQDMLEAERHGRQVRSIYVYEAPVRLWHWINALAIVVLAIILDRVLAVKAGAKK